MVGNNRSCSISIPRALTPLPLLSDKREMPGELLQTYGKHRLVHPTVPVMRRLNGLFEVQALGIKGSDDWYEIHLCLLSDSFLRQRPSSVNHQRVCDCHHCCAKYKCQRILSCRNKSDSVGMHVSDRSSSCVCPSLSVMKAATVNGKQLQELKSKPGVQVIFAYTDLAYPHIGSLLAGSVKIISVKREKGLL